MEKKIADLLVKFVTMSATLTERCLVSEHVADTVQWISVTAQELRSLSKRMLFARLASVINANSIIHGL